MLAKNAGKSSLDNLAGSVELPMKDRSAWWVDYGMGKQGSLGQHGLLGRLSWSRSTVLVSKSYKKELRNKKKIV